MARFKSMTVGIPVPNLERAVAWYRRLLGGAAEINPAPGVWEFRVTSSAWLQLLEGREDAANAVVSGMMV